MTNREALMKKMDEMSDDELAFYLDGYIEEDISSAICSSCQLENHGICIMEANGLSGCPMSVSQWLGKQTNNCRSYSQRSTACAEVRSAG